MATGSYPPYAAIRARRLAARRVEAIGALRAAERLARQAGGRLLVFGSLVEGGFHERSDLDVAILGLGPPEDSQVAAAVDTALATAGFSVDVIPERLLPPSLRERILAHGREPGTLG